MHRKLRSSTSGFVLSLALSLGVGVGLSLMAPSEAAAAAGGSGLTAGQKLTANQTLKSPNGKYTLILQGDGNLVLYGPGNKALWASGVHGTGHYAVMQADGNLVVYDAQGSPRWYSGTWEEAGATLTLQDDGNLVLYRGGKPVWHTNTWERDTRLDPGEKLVAGKSITSSDDRYSLVMQGDGNLVLYGPTGPKWASNTSGSGLYAVMQGDGNLVVYDSGGTAKWNSGTWGKNGAYLQMQPDGNVVLYKDGAAQWHTNTWERATELRIGEVMKANDTRFSPDGKHKLVMQGDGNLVLYGPSGAVWASKTQGSGFWAIMQSDGNLVIYDAANQAKFATGTGGKPGALLKVLDGGTLKVVQGNTVLWTNAAPAGPVGPASGNVAWAVGPGGCRIQVDSSIKANVEALLAAANAAGVFMCGWGWRSHERQIQLRIEHCGGNSHFAIWEKPSSQCVPPTAVPGRSMHETGLAIDFTRTNSGGTLRSSDPHFAWMKANAARFGLRNLPSEAWHWSTNGN